MLDKLFKKNNIFIFVCLLVIFLQFFQVAYIKRSYFLTSYDASYWKDRIDHSQWVLPLSSRIIGDDGLYSYVGLSLVKGASPAALNAEIPPLGKYLIGLSIVLFGSPAYYAFIFGIGCLILFYLISKRIFKDDFMPVFVTTFLMLDPLFIGQLWTPWLDIVQLFFLLANIYLLFIWKSAKKNSYVWIILAGIALGLFAETKPPLLFPIIAALEVVYFFISKKRVEVVLFVISIALTIPFVYLRYFWLGNSFLDFIKLQKYIESFYLKSQLSTHFGAIWSVLFIGKFPNISSGTFQNVGEWWIVWPIITVLGVGGSVKYVLSKNDLLIRMLSIFLILGLIIYSFIPSYSRYLLLLLPFLYLLTGIFLEKYVDQIKFKTGMVLLILLATMYSTFYLLPTPEDTINNFEYSFSHMFFKDIYIEDLIHSADISSPEKFDLMTKNVFAEGEIKSVSFKNIGPIPSRLSREATMKLQFTYKTQNLGIFQETKNVQLKKENGSWKIVWDWNLLVNGYKQNYSLTTTRILGKRGTVRVQGSVVVEDAPGFILSVNPDLVDRNREEKMLKLLYGIFGVEGVGIHNAYNENIIPNTYIPIATTFYPLNAADQKEILKYPGLKLDEYPSRIYTALPKDIKNTLYYECCTKIYSSYNYHGFAGVEKKYDNVLWGEDGGTLLLLNEKGKVVRTIIKKKEKNGQNINI